jgi:peptidoglycan/xylan/chitin deacetylase (PgdA/CDA1 family)
MLLIDKNEKSALEFVSSKLPSRSRRLYLKLAFAKKTLSSYLRRAILRLAKTLGMFWISRRLTRNGLRILCYHGFAEFDEHLFRPMTFIHAETFRARLKYLARHHYPVLSLEEALRRMDDGTMPKNATVITIDDGFSSTHRQAISTLAEFGFPATVYITTYYCVNRIPGFALAIQYMFWKTDVPEMDLDGLGNLAGRVSLSDPETRIQTFMKIIHHGETVDKAERQQLTQRVGERLGVDYGKIIDRRSFDLMTLEELQFAADAGLYIQVHTHRHRFPLDEREVRFEIEECRHILKPIAKAPLVHFCYPSGYWREQHLPWLKALGIQTAVTCESGLNYKGDNLLTLHRFLDSDDFSPIEFEAEMSGFKEFFRRGRTLLRSVLG